jgi:hypothetical protein
MVCYHRYCIRESQLKSMKKWYKTNQKRILRFKGRHVLCDAPVRTGICAMCQKSIANGEIKRTNIHHWKYDEKDPLRYTIEVCVGCHSLIHERPALMTLGVLRKWGKI